MTSGRTESERVPNTMDLMGHVRGQGLQDGELLGFRRLGRYQRAAL
jgi:hypothetical protein